jgi:hypothetical protein
MEALSGMVVDRRQTKRSGPKRSSLENALMTITLVTLLVASIGVALLKLANDDPGRMARATLGQLRSYEGGRADHSFNPDLRPREPRGQERLGR